MKVLELSEYSENEIVAETSPGATVYGQRATAGIGVCPHTRGGIRGGRAFAVHFEADQVQEGGRHCMVREVRGIRGKGGKEFVEEV